MYDISRRRRIAGRALVGAAVLALPLTASITYAEIPAPPEPPAAPMAPMAPHAPWAPEAAAAPLAPEAPEPPEPPEAPGAPDAIERKHVRVVRIAPGQEVRHEIRREVGGGQPVFVIDGKRLSEEEFEARMEAFGEDMERWGEQLGKRLEHAHRFDETRIRTIELDAERMAALAPEVRMDCDAKGKASDVTTAEGKRVIRVCQRQIMRSAIAGLRSARNQIARNHDMQDEVRRDVLASLDREIARIEAERN